MSNLIVLNPRIVLAVLLLVPTLFLAQSKHVEKFNASKDVLVEVNTSHTNIIFETWNKDMVEVEAFVEGEDLSEKEKEEIFKNWKFDILGNSKKVVISSNSGSLWGDVETFAGMESLKNLHKLESLESLKGLEVLENLNFDNMNFDIKVPKVPELEKMPKWPFNNSRPSVSSGKGNYSVHIGNGRHTVFDITEYEKDKKAYVSKLNRKYDSNVSVQQTDKWLKEVDDWSNNIEVVMEKWGEKFGKEFSEKFGPEFEMKMEKWGEEFGKKMEIWGENFGKDMEKWAEQFEKDASLWEEQFEDGDGIFSKEVITDENGNKNVIITGSKKGKSKLKGKKTIIIRMPKGARTDINVRYGEIKMANAMNIKATLNYSPFIANSVDGGKTLINASYAPVTVGNWNDGTLLLKFVDQCNLKTVREINLNSNSSDVIIDAINERANLNGSFGNLVINAIATDFDSLDIVLENTDANIKIPKGAFSFYYNGKKSTLLYPKALQLDSSTEKGRVLVSGFNKSNSSGKTLSINAVYSNIKVQ